MPEGGGYTVDLSKLFDMLQQQGMKLFSGLLVLIVGLFLAHWINKLIGRNERFKRVDPTLRGFLTHLIRLLTYVLVVLTAANVMGIPLTSFVTLLASAGVAVSLAMQGALSNLVGGMIILVLKPFRAGDYVKIGDIEGSIQTIGIFYTEMATPDNRHISLPNSNITNTAVVNYSREGTRRMDIQVTVSYDSDIDRVKAVLMGVLKADGRILPDPEPMAMLNKMGDSALEFLMRYWCRSGDYWATYFDITENAKKALDASGIRIPFPQLDVHMDVLSDAADP